ncbi:MAG: divergent polysaccharide deacetylase family protein [Pacificimonas sp.]
MSTGRIILTVFGGAVLFVGLATLFAHLLRPFAPAKAAQADQYAGADRPERDTPESREDLRRTLRDNMKVGGGPEPLVLDDGDAAQAAGATTPPPDLPDGPVIAIVMTELGSNAANSRRAIADLPAEITFTFTPYAAVSPALAKAAKAEGHEVFVSLPMEPQRYPRINPGENTLLRASDASENLERLDWALTKFADLDGTTGMMGSAFTQDAVALRPVMKELHMRGLTYIDARASGRSVAERTARDSGVPSRSNDRFIDEPPTGANIGGNLSALIATAKRRGYAIGYARPLPATITALEAFGAEAEAAGVTLVGAARLARGLPDDV